MGVHAAIAAVAAIRPGDAESLRTQLGVAAAALGVDGVAVHVKDPTTGGLVPGPSVGRVTGADIGALPLVVGDETVGEIRLAGMPHPGPGVASLATALALALRSGQLFDGLQHRARDLDREVRLLMALQDIAAAVNRAPGVRDVAAVVASRARRLLRGTAAGVVARGPDGPELLGQEGVVRPVAVTAAVAAIATGTPQLLPGPVLALPIEGDAADGGAALVVATDGVDIGEEDQDRLSSLSQQAAIAFTNARLLEQLRDEQAHRAEVTAALVSAQEHERQRIAEALHDGPVQELVGLGLLVDALANDLRAAGIDDGDGPASASSAARRAIGTLREAIFDLHPMSLEKMGFAAAVHVVLNRAAQRGVEVHMDGLDAVDALSVPLRTVAFRVVQEAVANAINHSGGAHITVSAGPLGDRVWLEVADDGRGFDVDALRSQLAEGHLGIEAMRERARLAGAELELASTPGSGTNVRLRVPVTPAPGA